MCVRPLVLLLACAFTMPAAAQDPVLRPGGEVLAADSIAERVEAFDVLATDRDGEHQPVGLQFLITRRGPVSGTDAIARTEVLIMDSMVVSMDSIVLDRRTLAPLLVRSRDFDTERTLDFSPGRARYVPRQGVRPQETQFVAPVFLDAATDLLLNALPLAAGYTVNLAAYDPHDGVYTMVVRVEGEEDVALPSGGSVSAWRVHVETDDGPVTYWMDRESRTLVQLEKAGGMLRIVRSRSPRFGPPAQP